MSEELVSAYDIRGTKETGLTVECAWNVGKALADWLPTNGNVAVAYTLKQTNLARAIIEGLRLQGRDVIDAGHSGKDFLLAYITTGGLSGAVRVGFDELEKVSTIELYNDQAKLIDGDNGLEEIRQLVEAGNFVPAVVKGQLTSLG